MNGFYKWGIGDEGMRKKRDKWQRERERKINRK